MCNNSKRILFLSGLDFKEKSIQVIRKTPDAYSAAGWYVDYVVARDNNPNGNYFYEAAINPEGVNVIRIFWPFPGLRSNLPRFLWLLFSKFVSLIVVVKLAMIGAKQLKMHKYDIIYGYELHGVLAMNLLRLLGLAKKIKKISRFQGTFLNDMFEKKQYFRLLFNSDLILALRLDSDLLIMTNDGTQGDKAVARIKGKKKYNSVFWVNGVDLLSVNCDEVDSLRREYLLREHYVFLSVSRLVRWKRIDKGLMILSELKKKGFTNFKYLIVGDGDSKTYLQEQVVVLGLQDDVVFVGSVQNKFVKYYLAVAHFFLSMYDSSNVGNPLLEAIRSHKIIITLSNGDTANWITHGINGLIYNPNDFFYKKAADDILNLIRDKLAYDKILYEVEMTEKKKLWTWDERLRAEIDRVESLLCH